MSTKRTRRSMRFSLRSMLVVATLAALLIGGWLMNQRDQAHSQWQAARSLESVQAEIYSRPDRIWTALVPDAPGRVVGVAIRSRQARDDQLKSLADFEDLIWLDLNDTQVTDAGMACIADLVDLERLRLDGTSIGDEGLVHLSHLKKLHQINLYNTRITDDGLEQLARLPKLKELFLLRSQVTDVGLRRLREARPGIQLHLIDRVFLH